MIFFSQWTTINVFQGLYSPKLLTDGHCDEQPTGRFRTTFDASNNTWTLSHQYLDKKGDEYISGLFFFELIPRELKDFVECCQVYYKVDL